MSKLVEKIKNDLAYEHDAQHYSDEWTLLKDRCSTCYKLCEALKGYRGRKADLGRSIGWEKTQDEFINPNPLG